MTTATMAEVKVIGLLPVPLSAWTVNVRIEFENSLVLNRRDMEVENLIWFLDRIKPVL